MTGVNLYNADLTDTKVSDETLKGTILGKTVMLSGKRDDFETKFNNRSTE